MSKVHLTSLGSLTNEQTALSNINTNTQAISDGFDNTLSRNGATPNVMNTSLDMNSHQILNLPIPSTRQSPLRLKDLEDFIGTGTIFSAYDPRAYGAIGDGIADDYLAIRDCINAAVAAHGTIELFDGTYNHSLSIDWGYNDLRVVTRGQHVIFQHTGSGVAHYFDGMRTTPVTHTSGCVGTVVGYPHPIYARGNPNGATTELLHIDNYHFGYIGMYGRDAHTIYKFVDTGPVGASAVETTFDFYISSARDQEVFSVNPGYGLLGNSIVACIFVKLGVENCGAGSLPAVQLINCQGNHFNTGTTEGNSGGGFYLNNTSHRNMFSTFHSEANGTGYDWDIAGHSNIFIGCAGGGSAAGIRITGQGNTFLGGEYGAIVDNGTGTVFIGPFLDATLTGTNTTRTVLNPGGNTALAEFNAPLLVKTTDLAAKAVTLAKVQDIPTATLLGRANAGTGVVEQLSLGGAFVMAGTEFRTAAHTGDVTSPSNSLAMTLATVNSNVGTFGDASHVAVPTVDGKGRITAITNTAISGVAPGGSAGGDLTGTYPNPTLVGVITAGGPTGSATVTPVITYDAKGRLTTVTSATVTPAIGSITGLGTGVGTALAVNVGSAGAPVTFNGAGGTPSSITLTNAGGTAASLTAGTANAAPISGLTGAGTGVLTALALNVGSAGAPVTFNGAGGTPSSLTATNVTGLPTAGLVDAAVTYAKIQNVSATGKLLGRANAGAGVIEEISLGGAFVTAGTQLQTAAHTGDVTSPTNSLALTIGATKVTSAMLNADVFSTAHSWAGLQSFVGTTTNDNATAGNVGEYIDTGTSNSNANATVTMTIAAPCVVTWTTHKFTVGAATTAIKFTTSGALPTGIVSGTTYYLKAVDANTFNIATTVDNALAGTFITTTGSQSGTHTGDIRVSMTSATPQNVAAISLGAGDWDISGQMLKGTAGTTTITYFGGNMTTTTAAVDRTFGRRLTIEYSSNTFIPGATEFTVFDFAPARFSLSGTTTIYLVADDAFGTSTLTSSGWLRARRVR